MKKNILLILTLFSLHTSAQTKKEIGYGFKLGAGRTILALDRTVDPSITTNNSYQITAFLNYPVSEKFNFQPSLSFSQKGGTAFETFAGDLAGGGLGLVTSASIFKPNYLELPLNGVLKLPLGKGNVVLGGGPYFAYAVSGKIDGIYNLFQNDGSFTEVREERKINYGNESSDDFSPIDYGLGFLVGYQIKKGWLLNFNYSQGIANILPKEQRVNENKAINGAFQFCLGYEF